VPFHKQADTMNHGTNVGRRSPHKSIRSTKSFWQPYLLPIALEYTLKVQPQAFIYCSNWSCRWFMNGLRHLRCLFLVNQVCTTRKMKWKPEKFAPLHAVQHNAMLCW